MSAAIPSSESLKYLGDLCSVSLDYLLSDSADAPEQNRQFLMSQMERDGYHIRLS